MKRYIKGIFYHLGINPHNFFHKNNDYEIDIAFEALKRTNNGIMIDVGFAWGQASLPFLIAGWHAFGFEPDTAKSKQLAIQKLKYHFPKLSISNKAVSDSDNNSLSFFTSDESEGIASLHAFKDHELSHQVSTISLDSIVKKHQIEEIHFLKIDVEGHDLSVLKSLDFRSHTPLLIVVEFDDFKTKPLGYDYCTIGEFLLKRGYQVLMFEWAPIIRYGTKHSLKHIKKFPCSMSNENGWGNFLAYLPSYQDKIEHILTTKYSDYL